MFLLAPLLTPIFGTVLGNILAFAISTLASSIISKSFTPDNTNNKAVNDVNPGNQQQIPPATDNKLPVVYGTGWVGGTIVDLSISDDNQTLYYVLALSEVTNTEGGGSGDVITFGDVFYGGKKCVFSLSDTTKVTGLLDTSTGQTDSTISGYINMYFYRNGSSSGTNTSSTAISIMSAANCTTSGMPTS